LNWEDLSGAILLRQHIAPSFSLGQCGQAEKKEEGRRHIYGVISAFEPTINVTFARRRAAIVRSLCADNAAA